MTKNRAERLVETARSWLEGHPSIEAVLWFIGALACIAILVWFLGFSGFGDPPEFVYEQF